NSDFELNGRSYSAARWMIVDVRRGNAQAGWTVEQRAARIDRVMRLLAGPIVSGDVTILEANTHENPIPELPHPASYGGRRVLPAPPPPAALPPAARPPAPAPPPPPPPRPGLLRRFWIRVFG